MDIEYKTKNIFSFPRKNISNPYLDIFYNELKKYNYYYMEALKINDNWLKENQNKIDILHFHWPEDIWRVRGKSTFSRLKGVIGFWRYLRLAHRLNIKIWWTLHNLEHHEGADFVDRLGYKILAQNCDVVICHSNYAKNAFKKEYSPRGKVLVMYHGTYEGIYPPPEPRDKILSKLGLNPKLPTFSCIGNIRHYKGFDLAIDAVNLINKEIQLIVAGSVHKDYDISILKQKIKSNKKIKLITEFLSDQEFSNIVAASDAVILPYRKITTSGLFLAVLTLGKPAIVADHPYFREIVQNHEESLEFFEPNNISSLKKAILSFLSTNYKKRINAIKVLQEKYKWSNCIKALVENL